MKIVNLFFALLLCIPISLFAQEDLVGDWKIDATNPDGSVTKVKLSIQDDGSYIVDFEMDGKKDVDGSYSIEGNQITVWDTSGDFACPSTQKGIYKFTVEDNTLTMERVKDDCPSRGGPEPTMVFSRI